MNCFNHLDLVAVAQCSNCGKGMCSDCTNASEYAIDNKPMCRECNYSLITDLIAENKRKKTTTIIKLAINGFFLALGIIVLFQSPVNGIILCAIGGIPTAWKATKSTPEERMRNHIDDTIADRDGIGGGLMNSFIRFLIRVVIAIVIGAIAAPILLIINIVKLQKIKKAVQENENLLLNFAQ